jgi:hypothetical protein
MSAIEEYVEETEKLINQLPYRLSTKIHAENRGEVALYLRGEIVFANRSELHFREYFITIPKFRKIAYSYHYQNNDKELIFRFDNTEHYPDVSTYPHHKHLKDKVLPSKEISLQEIVNEIITIISA